MNSYVFLIFPIQECAERIKYNKRLPQPLLPVPPGSCVYMLACSSSRSSSSLFTFLRLSFCSWCSTIISSRPHFFSPSVFINVSGCGFFEPIALWHFYLITTSSLCLISSTVSFFNSSCKAWNLFESVMLNSSRLDWCCSSDVGLSPLT